jgi:hypothetical protein
VITDRRPELASLIHGLLEGKVPLEDYGFDITPVPQPMPQPDGNVVLGACYLLVISCRSPVLAPPRMYAAVLVEDGWPREPELSPAIGKCLADLERARGQLLMIPRGQG